MNLIPGQLQVLRDRLLARYLQPVGHIFYNRMNRILDEQWFDAFAESSCEKYYGTRGRPSVAPGVYFRMLLVGYFEGLTSERGIA